MAGHVSPAKAKAQIKRAVALAARKVLAGEQPRADDVAKSHRQLGRVSRFAPQAEFHVEALVLECLTPADGGVRPVGDFAVAEACLDPIERLHEDVAAR